MKYKTINKYIKAMNRRKFFGVAAAAGTGMAIAPSMTMGMSAPSVLNVDDRPALLGGPRAQPDRFPQWPIHDETEQQSLSDVLRSNSWGRLNGRITSQFEEEYAKLTGVNHCLATASGTTALYTMLGALDVGPGDEVILPTFTFIATHNVVTLNYALPILVDTDIDHFQIDIKKMEEAITPQTKVLMPVYMGGSPADIDGIMDVAQRHNLPVIEDACQAPGSEWRGKKVGSFGIGGAFSFQSSKNLNSAEGGAITTNDENFYRRCFHFHHQGENPAMGTRATNARLTEFQSSILLAQMRRFEEQSRIRSENATYLTSLLNDIPGIIPAKLYEGVTGVTYHFYMFRYDKSHFADLPRARFMQAMGAEGVRAWSGYGDLNKDPYVLALAQNKHYLKLYGERTMQEWLERIQCPQNDKLFDEQIWFTQAMLLGTKTDMDRIAEAIRKIQKYARELKQV